MQLSKIKAALHPSLLSSQSYGLAVIISKRQREDECLMRQVEWDSKEVQGQLNTCKKFPLYRWRYGKNEWWEMQ